MALSRWPLAVVIRVDGWGLFLGRGGVIRWIGWYGLWGLFISRGLYDSGGGWIHPVQIYCVFCRYVGKSTLCSFFTLAKYTVLGCFIRFFR